MQDISRRPRCSIREFARMIGSLVSVCPTVLYGLLYTKRFEQEKFLGLEKHPEDYNRQMSIPKYLKENFRWWINVFSNITQYNAIRSNSYACEIFSDASLTGWGAACGNQRTHGWWSEETKTLHINALELTAAFYALKCFATNLRNCNILLRLDNTTALSYINRFGSVQHPLLSNIFRDIWQWCKERKIFLFASYIASLDNVVADAESRILDTDTELSAGHCRRRRSTELRKNLDPFI